MDPLDQAAREDAWLRGWNEKGAGSERRLPGLERCGHLSRVAGTPRPGRSRCASCGHLCVGGRQGCPREVGAREGRSLPRLRKEQILKLRILMMFTVGLPNARLRGIPQRCAGRRKTGHEAE